MCLEKISSYSTPVVVDRTLCAGSLLLVISIIAWGIILVGYLDGHFGFSSLLFTMPSAPLASGLILFAIAGCLYYSRKKQESKLASISEPILADRDKVRDAAQARVVVKQQQETSVATKQKLPAKEACEKKKSSEKGEKEKIQVKRLQTFPTASDFKEGFIPLHHIMIGGAVNPFTDNIAKHWVSNAATRVFHNPFRGIVELVNNALDAANPEHPIGQHGFCFFSALSFLIKRFNIEITTTYLQDSIPFSYKMIISREKGNVFVNLEKIKNKEKTGTIVSIQSNGGAFSKKHLKQMIQSLHILQFYPHGKILVLKESSTFYIGEGDSVNAYVNLNTQRVTIEDHGCGISLEIASKYLFVPSSTNKKRNTRDQSISLPEFVEYQGKKEKHSSSFLLSAGGVIVMEIPLDSPLKKKNAVTDLHLKLPESTHLTLSHDCVQLDDPKKETESYLREVLKQIIKKLIECEKERSRWCLTLFALYQGFSLLEKRNFMKSSFLFSSCIIENLQMLSRQENVVPVPFEKYGFFLNLLEDHTALYLPFHTKMWNNFDSFERLLIQTTFSRIKQLKEEPQELMHQALNREVIANKCIIFIPDLELVKMNAGTVASLGCDRILFAASSILDEARSTTHLGSLIIRQFAEEGKKIEIATGDKGAPFIVIHGDARSLIPTSNEVSHFPLEYLPEAPYAEFASKHSNFLKAQLKVGFGLFSKDYNISCYQLNENNEIFYISERTLDEIILSSEETTKLLLLTLLMKIGIDITDPTHVVKSNDGKTLWPIKKMCHLEQLEELIFLLVSPKTSVIDQEHLDKISLEALSETVNSFAPFLKFLNISITRPFFHLALLKEIFSSTAGPAIDDIIYRFKRYYSFSDHELDAPLSKKREITTKAMTSFGCIFSELYAFLKYLETHEVAYNKAFWCLQEYAREHLDLQKRNLKMQRSRTLDVHDILTHNGVALLSHLKLHFFSNQNALLLKQELLIFCRSEKELFFICVLLNKIECDLKLFVNFDKIVDKIKFFISNYLRYQCNLDLQNSEKIHEYAIILKKYLASESFTSSFSSTEPFIAREIQSLLKTATPFLSSQLLCAVFSGEDIQTRIKTHPLPSIMDFVSQQESVENFKMLEDCIQHGTERPAKEATLIETFQNSADAIQSFSRVIENPKNVREAMDEIECQVSLIQGEELACAYEISDRIGMKSISELLINFLVPNYSEKRGLVGEMGNGFFQIYREAKMISLTTRLLEDPSQVYFVLIEPVIDSRDGIVRDAKITLLDISKSASSDFFGTKIRVLFRNQNQDDESVELEALCLQDLITEKLGGSLIRISPHQNVKIFLKNAFERRELSGVSKNVLTYDGGYAFEFHQLERPDGQGSVLTQGCPFKSIELFLIESHLSSAKFAGYFAHGWCLNLPAKTYKPVQNRMQLQLKPDIQEHIQTFLCETFYYRLTLQEKNFPGCAFIPHYRSQVYDFSQVYPGFVSKSPSKAELQNNLLYLKDHRPIQLFYLYYTPSFLQDCTHRSFMEFIDDAYKNLIPQLEHLKKTFQSIAQEDVQSLFKNECRKLFNEWQKRHLQMINGSELAAHFFTKIVVGWLGQKVLSFSSNLFMESASNLPKPKADDIFSFDQLNLQGNFCPIKLAAFFLESYCDQFCLINRMNKKIKVDFEYAPKATYKAYYSKRRTKIIINCAHFRFADLLEIGLGLVSHVPISAIKVAEDLFLPSLGKGGTLNHELEHARRDEGCSSLNAHSDDYDADGHFVSFEACAASYARCAISKGLIHEWHQVIEAHLLKNKIGIEELKQDIATIREYESIIDSAQNFTFGPTRKSRD